MISLLSQLQSKMQIFTNIYKYFQKYQKSFTTSEFVKQDQFQCHIKSTTKTLHIKLYISSYIYKTQAIKLQIKLCISNSRYQTLHISNSRYQATYQTLHIKSTTKTLKSCSKASTICFVELVIDCELMGKCQIGGLLVGCTLNELATRELPW